MGVTLSHAEIVPLIHTAHENGRITYFSAGLEMEQIAWAVYCGVDGLGIGTSLHSRDPVTGVMGAFKPDAIRQFLQTRDAAAQTVRGRAAKLLARLDYQYFEKSLPSEAEPDRQLLYQAVLKNDTATQTKLLEKLEPIVKATPEGTGHKTLDHAARLMAASHPVLSNVFTASKWEWVKREINSLIAKQNTADLRVLLDRIIASAEAAELRGVDSKVHERWTCTHCNPVTGDDQ